MNVRFHVTDDRPGQWAERNINVVPRVGEHVVWHGRHLTGNHTRFKVINVTHVYEDRTWYAERQSDFGDTVWVTLAPVE